MSFTIVIEQKASNDIAEAITWYSDKSPLAAENFQREITEAFKYLQTFFAGHRKVFVDIQLASLRVFL